MQFYIADFQEVHKNVHFLPTYLQSEFLPDFISQRKYSDDEKPRYTGAYMGLGLKIVWKLFFKPAELHKIKPDRFDISFDVNISLATGI